MPHKAMCGLRFPRRSWQDPGPWRSDRKFVGAIAGWAARDAGKIGNLLLTESVVHLNLIEKSSCLSRSDRQGMRL